MASVSLDFVPPDIPNLAKLYIYEAPAKDGPWTLIETVTAVGVYGNYLSRYTTQMATSVIDWFSIQWEDDKGAQFGQSSAVKGGTETAVSEITDRVLLRDASIAEAVAEQEAEAVVEDYFGTTDSLSIDRSVVTAKELSGLTMLALARAKLFQIYTGGTASDYTAGLVSQKSSTQAALKLTDIKDLLSEANTLLGRNFTCILQMDEIEIAGGSVLAGIPDASRLIVEVI